MTNQTLAELEQQVLARPWFYEFKLPSGKTTPTYGEGRFNAIHDTRQRMIDDALTHRMNGEVNGKTVIDLACNQGYFSAQMAARGAASIHGIDARQEHIDDALLIHRAMGYDNFSAEVCDIEDVSKERFGQFDIVLMLGLIYHLENPVGAIRRAHALTRDVCFIETQVVPGMNGYVDWGSHDFVRPLMGSFGILDETDEVHATEASTLGICLAPNIEGLMWIMKAVGFDRVELLHPRPGDYEQHLYRKRVMVAGYVDE